jgi:hypothetical protein
MFLQNCLTRFRSDFLPLCREQEPAGSNSIWRQNRRRAESGRLNRGVLGMDMIPRNWLGVVPAAVIIFVFSGSFLEIKAQTPSAKTPAEVQSEVPPAQKPQEPAKAPPPDNLKNPWPWLTLGADFRFRWEYQFDVFTLNDQVPEHEYSYQRFRARIWAKIHPLKQLDFNVRLTTEPRTYLKPDRLKGWVQNDLVFDNLNVVWRDVARLPITLTVGRQDIMLGNGWLILEGTPLDGSRTTFFDAARLTYALKSTKTTVDLIGISQSAFPDRWVSPLNYHQSPLVEQNENGAIAYVTNKSLPKTQIDGYFIYRHDTKVLPSGDNGDIYAFGARVEGNISNHWMYRSEFAPELGNMNSQKLSAFGTNNRVSYFWKDRINHNVRVGYEYLSGDNSNTPGTNEGFAPLYGRWPQWSELLLYNFATETRVGYWTNLQRIDFGWSSNPTNKMELSADYMPLFANGNPLGSKPGFSQDGRFRGQLATALMRYRFNGHLSGHFLGELFLPGDYYSAQRQDPATFLRLELIVAW